MATFIVLVCILFIFILFVWFIKNGLVNRDTLWNFKHCNVIVAGKKGTGKDVLFNWVIKKRHDFYYANISYGREHKIIKLKDVSCFPNTYYNLINDKVEKTKHMFKEGKDIYISDIGNFLPSYMDSTLYKYFPSMPLFYSLSRHLYSNNVHCNTQNIERGWKALREQADFYIQVKRTHKLFGLLFITKYYSYDRYDSAKQNLLPIKTRILNKYSKAEADLYRAQNGEIKKGYIFQWKWSLKYDTRAFEKVLLKGKRKK